MPQWIFFDCCRTLIDVNEVGEYWTRMAPIAVEAGVCSSEDVFNQAYVSWQIQRRQEALAAPHPENPLPDGLKKILLALNPSVSAADVEIVVGKMVAVFFANCLPGLCPTPGLRRMLDAWRGSVKMGVVSDYFLRDCPRRLLAALGLDGYFKFVLDSASVGFRKPAEEIYLEALRRAGLARDQVDQVMFVGDNLALDVMAPAAMGMRAIYYHPSQHDRIIERTARPYPSIAHWDELRPDSVAKRGGVP